MKKTTYFVFIISLILFNCSSNNNSTDSNPINDTLYFPPINSDSWETISVSELNWNEAQLQPLLDYLEQKKHKRLYNAI